MTVGTVGAISAERFVILHGLFLVIGWWRRNKVGGSEGRLLANAGSPNIEGNGDGYEDGSHTTKERGSPLDTHTVEHVGGEQRETGTGERTEKGVTGNGRSSAVKNPLAIALTTDKAGGIVNLQHEVGIDQVVQSLKENGHETEAGKDTRRGGDGPVGAGLVSSPAEPEDTSRKRDTSGNDTRKTPFGDGDSVVGLELTNIPGVLRQHGGASDQLTEDHAEEGETGDARRHVVDTLEDKGVGRQEEVEQAINEGHVDGEQGDNGLEKEQTEGTAEVLADKLAEVHLNLLLLGMDTPVEGTAAQLGGFFNEDGWWVGLLHEDEVKAEGKEAHEGDDVLGPAPAEGMVRHDEATDEGRHEWTSEDSHGEQGDGDTSRSVVEHVGEDGGDDSKRTGPEETTKETADHDGLEILGGGSSDAEDGETEHGNNDG